MSVIETIAGLLIVTGSLFGVIGAVGMLRFPDLFTRMHAASVTDTLCALLVILGMVLLAGWSVASIKLLLILLFLWFTGATATHALAKAALHGGMKPLEKTEGGQ